MALIRAWLLLACVIAVHAVDEAPAWRSDFDVAVQESAGKPLAILVSNKGCVWCHRMLAESDQSPEVRQALKQMVGVVMQAEEHPAVIARLGIEAYPTLVLVNRKQELVRIVSGYQPAADLATALRVLALHGDQDGQRPADLRGAVDVAALAKGDQPVEKLVALLGVGEPEQRTRVREQLATMPAAKAALWQALADPHLGVRIDAAAVLARLVGDPPGYDAFASAAERAAAIAAWRKLAETSLPGGAVP